MTEIVEAIYENGVLRPIKPAKLPLPEGARVRITIWPSIRDLLALFKGVEAQEDIDEVLK